MHLVQHLHCISFLSPVLPCNLGLHYYNSTLPDTLLLLYNVCFILFTGQEEEIKSGNKRGRIVKVSDTGGGNGGGDDDNNHNKR